MRIPAVEKSNIDLFLKVILDETSDVYELM